MKIKPTILLFAFLFIAVAPGFSQINARMFRYPDVSASQIVFSYAGDIWIVNKSGGTANKLSSADGEELFAKFSPDGKQIAYNANYDGNNDIYVIPTTGGIPKRLTYHSGYDRMVEWNPVDNTILFASSRESGRQRFNQFYSISPEGGMATKLAMPYGDFGSFSPDGKKLAFNFKSRNFRTWKRYRGGWAPDLWIFDLKNSTSTNITSNTANDEFPMWVGNKIYYLSDQGPAERFNLWSYNTETKQSAQLTKFTEFDVHFPSAGPNDIVFEAGGKLYLMNPADGSYEEVKINVITDQLMLRPKMVGVKDLLQAGSISPDGKRVAVTARGEVFSVPAENGYTKNLTNSSGVAERSAAWSPDGKKVAYWSDKNGEYQLALYDLKSGSEKILTSYTDGFHYNLYWSPDSKKLAFIDQTMDINYFDLDANTTVKVDKALYQFHGGLSGFSFSWSSDSRWLTYSRGLDNLHSAIFLFNTQSKVRTQVTSGFYNDSNPVFDPDGKYLYLLTGRSFSPEYSDVDGTFIYPNTTEIAAITLLKDTVSPLEPKNDEVAVEEEKEDSPKGKKKKGKNKDKEAKDDEPKPVTIDLVGFEQRMVILPIGAGNYASLAAVSGKLIYHANPNTGSNDENSPLKYYDLEERESKTIVDDVDAYEVAANGEKILILKGGNIYVLDVGADQKMDKQVDLSNMKTMLNPKEEWKQIFTDAWRLERDYFYDKNMHGVDWEGMKKQYGQLLDDAVSRWDVNFVIGELIGELSSSHTYRGGGDTEESKRSNVGYLGIDWEISNGYYRVKGILHGAQWDIEARSPLSMPGVDVKTGDYILAVNGIPLDIRKEPYAAFQGLAGQTVELTVNSTPARTGARKVIVATIASENRLRHLAWIEHNRKTVEQATGGRVGYIYVRSTGVDGQNELVRQFVAQIDKDALIIDERFNSGGQIPDRFVELLNRKPLAYWAVRDGKDWRWPTVANFGPKAMLINGWSGSGGDAFPDYFRKAGVGPLIGTRTWGGLIGISGAPGLIDGGGVTVPTFRMYDPDGKWFKEGHGVDPDIEVKENPGELAKGTDAQLQRAIQWTMEELKNHKGKPDHPPYEKR